MPAIFTTLNTIETPTGILTVTLCRADNSKLIDEGELSVKLTRPSGQEIHLCSVAHVTDRDVDALEIDPPDNKDQSWDDHYDTYVVPLR